MQGGLALGVHETACKLAEEFEVTVVSTWTNSNEPPDNLTYRLIAFPSHANFAGNPISSRFSNWIRQNISKFDLIHLHSHLFLMSLTAAALGRLSRKRMVLTNHGMISLSFPTS